MVTEKHYILKIVGAFKTAKTRNDRLANDGDLGTFQSYRRRRSDVDDVYRSHIDHFI